MILKRILKNLNKKIRKYNIKGSVLLLALFVLLFAFTIIIILYLINKRYVIYAKDERTNYLKGIYPQKKKQILSYLLKKAVKEFYSTSLIYSQKGLYDIYNTKQTFYSTIKLNGTINYLHMLYRLYSTNNSSATRYWIDFNLYNKYNNTTTIYATAKTVYLTNYLVYNNNSNFKFKDFFSKNTLNPLEKELIKKIIYTNKEQIKTVFQDLGTVTFESNDYNIYQIDENNIRIDSNNLSITKNIKNITIKFYVNNTPYIMIITNTEIKTSVSNIIELQLQPSTSNTIVYPYMNSYIKSTIIKSSNAIIQKL
ncbi:MAG: hypothetical protein ACP5O4_03330 [bacterium]